jgi:hypothetical protein
VSLPEAKNMDGLAGCASLRHHRDRVACYDDCVREREEPEIGIFIHSIPEKEWDSLKVLSKSFFVFAARASRSRDGQATPALPRGVQK